MLIIVTWCYVLTLRGLLPHTSSVFYYVLSMNTVVIWGPLELQENFPAWYGKFRKQRTGVLCHASGSIKLQCSTAHRAACIALLLSVVLGIT
jgi:hypothetical protein